MIRPALLLTPVLVVSLASVALAADKTDTRRVTPFTAIEASGAVELDVRTAHVHALQLIGNARAVANIVTSVKGHTLQIHPKPGWNFFKDRGTVRCIVTAPKIESLVLAGAVKADVHGLAGPKFRLVASGASSANLAGRTTRLTANVSGACGVEADQLVATMATLIVTGASHMTVNATRQLDASASGASSIRYVGKPKLTSHATGASSIEGQ